MRINNLAVIFTLGSVFFNFSYAQTPKSEFYKQVDSINAIIKANPQAYYKSNKQHSAFIKKISATEQGIVSFTDSILKPEIKTKRTALISDCCRLKSLRTLDLIALKKWDIIFPNAYLKDKNNEIFGNFIGFKKQDIVKLKEQFDKLTALCNTLISRDDF